MAVVFLLIRHASNDLVGKALAGRAPGVRLNAHGVREAEHLAERLGGENIAAIYVSPLERACETAAPLAGRLKLVPQKAGELHEVDLGDWTGRTFQELDSDPAWRVWVERRSEARPPNGESIVDVQRRVTSFIVSLRICHDGQTVALVSHGDVIKAALAHVMHISLDDLEGFDIAPASVSVVIAGAEWQQVKLVNDTGALPRP